MLELAPGTSTYGAIAAFPSRFTNSLRSRDEPFALPVENPRAILMYCARPVTTHARSLRAHALAVRGTSAKDFAISRS